jgi:hypothetical protein
MGSLYSANHCPSHAFTHRPFTNHIAWILSLLHETSHGLLTFVHIVLDGILSLEKFFTVSFFVGHSSQVFSKSLYDKFGKIRDNGTFLIE